MDRRDIRLIREIVAVDIVVIIISIFLWTRYHSDIGILITVVSMWTSFIFIRVVINKRRSLGYHLTDNCSIDRLIKKFVKW